LVAQTERLWIRQYAESDADRLYDTLRRWEVSRWLGDAPRVMLSRDEALQRIRAWRKVHENDPRYGLWAVEEKGTGRLVGCALLVPAPDPEQRYGGVVEVGWHLHPDSWGHGYAREAGFAAARKGFADGLEEVHAFVRPDNHASVRVCEGIGMQRYRTSRDEWYKGEWLQFRAVRQALS
jgi:RimJ/RimL family protein N-acetyltransferase